MGIPVFVKNVGRPKCLLRCFFALTTSTWSKMTSGFICKHQNCKTRWILQSTIQTAPNALNSFGRTLRGKTGSKNLMLEVVWPFSRRFFGKHLYFPSDPLWMLGPIPLDVERCEGAAWSPCSSYCCVVNDLAASVLFVFAFLKDCASLLFSCSSCSKNEQFWAS